MNYFSQIDIPDLWGSVNFFRNIKGSANKKVWEQRISVLPWVHHEARELLGMKSEIGYYVCFENYCFIGW